ncbi:MAG: enoyl-CoA hydratase/isomerase family protein [Chloroflexi bacterium]|nr:enoyl-CoA hydratase/isomerase family protein [Chloroflexota bacterium]
MEYAHILIEVPTAGVGLIRFNRPKALNALNSQLVQEMFDALTAFDGDDTIGCMIVTGNEKAFAAGADIKEMAETTYVEMFTSDNLTDWSAFNKIGKPVIAAVSGYAFGGGCEIAMMCDMIVASETAVFGQPEINLGIIPGGGGTQRLIRAVGKALAMEIILADRRLTAQEALHYGLVNRVVPADVYLEEAIKLAEKIASLSHVAVRMGKDAINRAYELTLQEGLNYEKRNFYLLFGTEDKKEGMAAFIEKRKPTWQHK